MNPEKEGLELAKEGVKDLLAPVTDILRDLLGPAATEIGLAWGDARRVWRLKRVVRLLRDVENAVSAAGLKLKPVAPRILFPLLEAASLEEDEDLHARWVALLTNAARTDFDSEVLPSFPDILKQLTPKEARILDKIYGKEGWTSEEFGFEAGRDGEEDTIPEPQYVGDLQEHLKTDKVFKAIPEPIVIENLERLMLVSRIYVPFDWSDVKTANTRSKKKRGVKYPFGRIDTDCNLYGTALGAAFVHACSLPGKQKR